MVDHVVFTYIVPPYPLSVSESFSNPLLLKVLDPMNDR